MVTTEENTQNERDYMADIATVSIRAENIVFFSYVDSVG